MNTLNNYKSLIIDIRGNTGVNDMYWMDIVSHLCRKDTCVDGFLLFRNNKVTNDFITMPDISLTKISDLPKKVYKNCPSETLSDFKDFVVKKLSFIGNSNSTFNGNIYLLVDNNIFSSSESFSIFCKESKFATLIGTATSGNGGGMDPVLFNLKNSGFIVRTSSDMFLTQSGICNEEFKTTPNFKIDNYKRTENFKDDNCIKKVLELESISKNLIQK